MHPRKPKENRFGYGVGILLALCASTYMVFSLMDGWSKYKESNKRLEASVIEIQKLENQYEDLKRERAHASSTTGVEMQIRSKFDLAKPEENVVFIISEEAPEPVQEEKGMQKFLNTFKNFFN